MAALFLFATGLDRDRVRRDWYSGRIWKSVTSTLGHLI